MTNSPGGLDLLPRPGDPAPRPTFSLGRWTRSVTAAEFGGFLVPSSVALLTAHQGGGVQLIALTTAGLFEGALLGWGQARVLRDAVPGLDVRRWVTRTAGAAGLAWVLGMLPSTSHALWGSWPAFVLVPLALLLGAGILLVIGHVQARQLAGHVPHPYSWVGWTAAGWAAGLGVFGAIAPPLWHQGQPLALVGMIGLGAGAAMAAAMAVVTGVGMRRLLVRQRSGAARSAG